MKHFLLSKSINLILILFSVSVAFSQTPLNGNYTINSAAPASATNFQTFNAFADSLNQNGVAGNVIATVVPGSGPYNEQVVFNNIAGTGPGATITLEGSGETITALTDSSDRYVIRLANVQYFTINNLKIERNANALSGFYGIHIYQSGQHITLSNNEVDMAGSTSTLVGGYIVSGSLTSILSGGDFHNINIVLNKTQTGGYGASVFGEAGNLSTNINIAGNEFISFNDNGVYLRETDGAIVSGNYFDKLTTNITGWNAIQVAQALNINTQIFNNEIRVSQITNGAMTIRGIYLFNGTGHKVYNNVIHNINLTSGNFTGIEIRTAGTAPEIYFNTINLDNNSSTTGNLYGIKEELSNTNSILRNNLINITQTTSGYKSALVLGATATVTTAFNSDYNWFWVPSGNIALRNSTTPTFYPTLANWQAASNQDANSLNIDPQVLAGISPVPTNIAGNDEGIAIAGITTDFLGVTRSSPPDIGAFEFGGCPPNAPAEIFGDTIVCENATGIMFTINPVSGAITYTWSVPAGAVINTGQGSTAITVDFGTQSGAITVTADDSCGSSPATTLVVDVEFPLSAPASIAGASSVCENAQIVTYVSDTVSGTTSYNWSVPAGATIVSGQGTNVILVNFGNTSGNISVEAVNSCGSSSATIFPVVVNPLPIVTLTLPADTVCQFDVLNLSGGTPVGGVYSGNGVMSGVFDATIAGPGSHTITYTFQDANSCENAAADDIFVEVCPGITEIYDNNSLNVYPNPFSGSAIIDIDSSVKPVSITIVNTTGEIVYDTDKPTNITVIEKEKLGAGIYILKVVAEDRILVNKKFVVY